jgi:hypothetical protein
MKTQEDQNKTQEENFRQRFLKDYFSNGAHYYFFESIYAYITGAEDFKPNKFEKEINAYLKDSDPQLPQYNLINQLDYNNFYYLNEKQYKEYTRKMVNYAEEGKYNFNEYLTAFHFALRFNNILNYDPEKLKNRIMKGLKKGKPNYSYVEHLEMALNLPSEIDHLPKLKEIRQEAFKINNEIFEKEQKQQAEQFLERLYNDWSNFFVESTNLNNKWIAFPFFKYASSYNIFVFLNKSNLRQIKEFQNFLKIRYQDFSTTYIKEDLHFLEKLMEYLAPNSKKRKRKTLKNYLLNELYNTLGQCIDKLRNIN